MWELDTALAAARETAPGPDLIHYGMLQHLNPTSKEILLGIFNNCGVTGISCPLVGIDNDPHS